MSNVHGSPADRGSADAYYGRQARPHYNQVQENGSMKRIEREDMTDEQIQDYLRAYEKEEDRKSHGAVFMTRPNKLKSATKTYNLLMRQRQWDMLSRKSHELTTLTRQQVSAADIIRLCIDMNMEETCNEIERRYRAQNY